MLTYFVNNWMINCTRDKLHGVIRINLYEGVFKIVQDNPVLMMCICEISNVAYNYIW